MSDCDHGWSDSSLCWECDEDREEEARWRALPAHVRAWRTVRTAVYLSRPDVAWRRARWVARQWAERHGLVKPRPSTLVAFDEMLKQVYPPESVAALAYSEHPLAAWIRPSGEPQARRYHQIGYTVPIISKRPPTEGDR